MTDVAATSSQPPLPVSAPTDQQAADTPPVPESTATAGNPVPPPDAAAQVQQSSVMAAAAPSAPGATIASPLTPAPGFPPAPSAEPLDPASARVAQASATTAVPVPVFDPRQSPQAPAAATPSPAAQPVPAPAANPVIASAAPVEKPKSRGFLASLFSQDPPRPQAKVAKPAATTTARVPAAARQVATLTPGNPSSVSALPGVNAESLFEIKRKSGTYEDSDVDANESEAPVRVASVTGLARLAPNGLAVQHAGVDVACLKPALVKVLKSVERRYGRKVVVTSGYRSPSHNRKARGAKNSLHMYCAAADIQISGVSKWQLASYLRSMPGRGGVGTYCHTESVHVDIGPERDWNWRCRRSSRKK